MKDFDVIVIGASLGGTHAALRAAEMGGKVCLIEKEKIGETGFLKRNILVSDSRYSSKKLSANWTEQSNKKKLLAEKYSISLKERLKEAGIDLLNGEGSLASVNEALVQCAKKSEIVKVKVQI